MYGHGYFELGQGSNYLSYGDDPGWVATVGVLSGAVPPPASILELGAAKGYFVRAARAGGYTCVGLDVSEYAVSRSDGFVQQADAADGLDFGNDSFDVVVSWELLEHIEEARIHRVAAEMDRVLRPGGVQLHRIGMLIPGREAEFYSDETHVLPWTRAEWDRFWPTYEQLPSLEAALDQRFEDRDWSGRFFAFRKPGVIRG